MIEVQLLLQVWLKKLRRLMKDKHGGFLGVGSSFLPFHV